MKISKQRKHHLQFQDHLETLKVDGYWVTHIPDLFYLAGFGAEGCWGLLGRGAAAMIVPALAADQAKALAPGFQILTATRAVNVFQTIIDYAMANGWKSVGYDPYRTMEGYISTLRKLSGRNLKWVPLTAATTPLRIKKDDSEINSLRKAGNLVHRGYEHIKKIAKPGLRECDLAAEFEMYIKKNGASKVSFDSIVAFGENAAFPHYLTGEKKLKKNDLILCDIGALVDGYCSDLTRTFFLGSITPLGRKVYDCVARAQRLSIEAVKPGVKTAQIDRISRDEIDRQGYGPKFIHSTGHGVGVEIHEAPTVGPSSVETLEPGMIITVEPGVYLQGWGGVRIEDTLLVTQTGYEILTK